MQCLEQVRNAEGKTSEDIMKESKPDHELFQTSSQELEIECYSSGSSEVSDEEDERPVKQPTRRDAVGTSDDGQRSGEGHQGIAQNQVHALTSQCIEEAHPEAQADNRRENEGDEIPKYSEDSRSFPRYAEDGGVPSVIPNPGHSCKPNDIPPRILSDPEPDGVSYHSISSLLLGDGSDGKTLCATEEPNQGAAKNLYGAGIERHVKPENSQPVKSSDATVNKARDSVKDLVRQTKLELTEGMRKLEEARWALAECEEKIKRLRKEKEEKEAEVQKLENEVQTKGNRLKDSEEFLSKLDVL